MSYYRHTLQSNPYDRIGRQDITAHANFTTLVQAGLARGLKPVALMTQREFLLNLGIDVFTQAFGRLDMPERDRHANAMALRDLVRPEGLGNYRVLVQAKDAPTGGLACLGKEDAFLTGLRSRLESLPVPRLGSGHIDLMAGRYGSGEAWKTGAWEDLLGGPGQKEGDSQ